MGLIKIFSDVDEEGRLHIPEKLTLKKCGHGDDH
jgi:hypothetical protein